MHFLRLYLEFVPNLLLAACLATLLWRGLQRRFPLLVAYLIFQVTEFVTLSIVDLFIGHYASLTNYRWTLVGFETSIAVLQIGALYELADELTRSRSSIAGSVRRVFRWSLASLLLFAVGSSALFHQPALGRVMSAFQTLDFCASLVGVGLLTVLLLFSRVLRISWRALPAGIALGFGVLGSVELAAAALVAMFGAQGRSAYIKIDVLRMAGAHACALIWLIYIFLPERVTSYSGARPQKADLDVWNEELERIARR
jgi:hypothetical protein